MAKLTTITDRKTGETRYPITSTKAVFDERGVDLDTLLDEQKRETANTLKGYATATELTESLATKQGNLSTTTDLQLTNDNVLGLTDMAKKRLFIDMWNARCRGCGKYNEITGYFEVNGLTDITYEDAINIMAWDAKVIDHHAYCSYHPQPKFRTNLPPHGSETVTTSLDHLCRGQSKLEVLILHAGSEKVVNYYVKGTSYNLWLGGCTALRKIIGQFIVSKSAQRENMFYDCPNIEDMKMQLADCDIDLSRQSKLSLASFQFSISSRSTYHVNLGFITLKVHPDIYAKLTDETNTEWHQVLLDAAEKNIQFATI